MLTLTVPKAFVIPFQFVRERYFVQHEHRTPFVKKATPFQDLVIRFVRFAFANMPAFIGRVFFSKAVSLPFLRFRMLRHGIVTSPIRWTEVKRVRSSYSRLITKTLTSSSLTFKGFGLFMINRNDQISSSTTAMAEASAWVAATSTWSSS